MKNRYLILALIAVTSASAFAGYKSTHNVVIQSNGISYGAMGTARNSADSLQYIGCELMASTSWSNLYCRARDSAGNTRMCWNDANAHDEMRQAVTAMTDSSWIRFDVDLGAADPTRCTFVNVINSSRYAPPQP